MSIQNINTPTNKTVAALNFSGIQDASISPSLVNEDEEEEVLMEEKMELKSGENSMVNAKTYVKRSRKK